MSTQPDTLHDRITALADDYSADYVDPNDGHVPVRRLRAVLAESTTALPEADAVEDVDRRLLWLDRAAPTPWAVRVVADGLPSNGPGGHEVADANGLALVQTDYDEHGYHLAHLIAQAPDLYRARAALATTLPEAPFVTIVAWGASPEQAEAVFDAAVGTAHDCAAPGVTVDAVATLRPGAALATAQPEADAVERAARAMFPHYFDERYGEHARDEARAKARAALAAAQPVECTRRHLVPVDESRDEWGDAAVRPVEPEPDERRMPLTFAAASDPEPDEREALTCRTFDDAGTSVCDSPARFIVWGHLYEKRHKGPKCARHLPPGCEFGGGFGAPAIYEIPGPDLA